MKPQTAKQFVLQLGSLASLYLSLGFFLGLVFGLVTVLFPDPLAGSWELNQAESAIRLGFAMTIVFFPAYLWLTRQVNQSRRTSEDGSYLGLTRWLIYLSLLVGGAVLLGDLVAIIMAWLEGELTTRFFLKAASVFIVAATAVYYYTRDAQGYWLERPWASILYGTVSTFIILATLAVAITQVASPQQVRAEKADETQVNDLRDWQWAIEDHLRTSGRLPEGIGAAYVGRGPVPQAPEGRDPYRYELTETGFSLCATFAATASQPNWPERPFMGQTDTPHITNPDDWYYEAGDWCFMRSVQF